jgi:hypothetical protein
MRKFLLVCLLVCVVGLPVLAQSQDAAYQAGKIINVERQPATGGGGYAGTDAAVKPETATYRISVQVNDTVYLVRMQAQGDQDLSWINGKDVQVRIAGKKMYVKRATGRDAKAGIISTTKASTP